MTYCALAYVVHVHNALNFDLDLEALPQHLLHGIAFKTYTYVDREEDRADLYKHRDARLYRCRIQHLARNHACDHQEFVKVQRSIMRLVDKLNGWIYVRPVVNTATHRLAVDRFGRILVDLFNPLTGENIAEWLLASFPRAIQLYIPNTGTRNQAPRNLLSKMSHEMHMHPCENTGNSTDPWNE